MNNFSDSVIYIGSQIRGSNLGEGWWEIARPIGHAHSLSPWEYYTQQLDAYNSQVEEFLKMKGIHPETLWLDKLSWNGIQYWVDKIWEESSQWGERYLGHFASVPISPTHRSAPPGYYVEVPVTRGEQTWWSRLAWWVGSGLREGKNHGSCGVSPHIPKGVVIPTGLQESERRD